MHDSTRLNAKYAKERERIVKFLEDHKLPLPEEIAPVFWNHMLSLLERVDENELNQLDIDVEFTPDEETKILAAQLISELSEIRSFDITQFEEFLILLYMQRLVDERRNLHG